MSLNDNVEILPTGDGFPKIVKISHEQLTLLVVDDLASRNVRITLAKELLTFSDSKFTMNVTEFKLLNNYNILNTTIYVTGVLERYINIDLLPVIGKDIGPNYIFFENVYNNDNSIYNTI